MMKSRLPKDTDHHMRKIFVQEPIDERTIEPGMNILYAEGQPIGCLTAEMAKVIECIDGRLENNTRGFRGVLPNGSKGIHELTLNLDLKVVSFTPTTSPTAVYDKVRAGSSPQEVFVNYRDGVLVFEWKDPHVEPTPGIEKFVIKSPEAYLCSKKDPRKMRLITPGVGLAPNDNTEEFVYSQGKQYRIAQHIPEGPTGTFTLPGYRSVDEDTYQELMRS